MRVFFALAASGACSLVSSAYAIEEARRNIAAKHPRRLADLEKLIESLETCAEPSPATIAFAAKAGLPPKDAPILAAAIEAQCHVLVTGDRTDFAILFGQRVRGTVVMLPAEAIELLLG